MKVLHVGGIGFKRYKTIQEAFSVARHDDVIELHKDVEGYVNSEYDVILKGNGHNWRVEAGKMGLSAQSRLSIENINFIGQGRSNAIVLNNGGSLDKVSAKLEGPIREFYSLVQFSGKVTVRDSDLMNVYSTDQVSFVDSRLRGYYGDFYGLVSRKDSSLIRDASFDNCELSHVILKNGSIINSILYPYVDIETQYTFFEGDDENGQVAISQSQVVSVPEEKLPKKDVKMGLIGDKRNFHGLLVYGDVTLSHMTFENPLSSIGGNVSFTGEFRGNAVNKLSNTTASFKNVVDKDNDWVFKNCVTSFVLTDIKTDLKMKTGLQKLEEQVGLENVKERIKTIRNTVLMGQGKGNTTFSNHMIFAGDPGTGKTTVAELVAQIFYEIGALPTDHLIKTKVSQLVKGYRGQSGENTAKLLNQGRGGVIFIDEAYTLIAKENDGDFNAAVLSEIIDFTESNRGDTIVILAGYTREMQELLASNVGFSRRVHWIEFEDYNASEMTKIFHLMLRDFEGIESLVDDDSLTYLFDQTIQLNLSVPDVNGRVTNGGNGGLVRNILQGAVEHRHNRVADGDKEGNLTVADFKFSFQKEMNKALARRDSLK